MPAACAPATSPCGSSPTYHVCCGFGPERCEQCLKCAGAGFCSPISAANEDRSLEASVLRLSHLQRIPAVAQAPQRRRRARAASRTCVARRAAARRTPRPSRRRCAKPLDVALARREPRSTTKRRTASSIENAPLRCCASSSSISSISRRASPSVPSAVGEEDLEQAQKRDPLERCRSRAYGRGRNRSPADAASARYCGPGPGHDPNERIRAHVLREARPERSPPLPPARPARRSGSDPAAVRALRSRAAAPVTPS